LIATVLVHGLSHAACHGNLQILWVAQLRLLLLLLSEMLEGGEAVRADAEVLHLVLHLCLELLVLSRQLLLLGNHAHANILLMGSSDLLLLLLKSFNLLR
jgi:hypothetical protein